MLYARQIAPQDQESPMTLYDEEPDGFAIFGNRDFDVMMPDNFRRIYEELIHGELLEALEAVEESDYSFYDTKAEAINDFLPPEMSRGDYTAEDYEAIESALTDEARGLISEAESLLILLKTVTGHTWKKTEIRRVCQSDWNNLYYDTALYSDRCGEMFEAEYFDTGTEWIIHDSDTAPESAEDVSGYCVYCYGDTSEEIAQELMGYTSDAEATLYWHDGYIRASKFTERTYTAPKRAKKESAAPELEAA